MSFRALGDSANPAVGVNAQVGGFKNPGVWYESTLGNIPAGTNLWATSSNYAVGDGGTILAAAFSSTSDPVWSPLTSGTTRNLFGVWASPFDNAVFAVGADGTVLHSDDTGATWQAEPVDAACGAGCTLRSVWKDRATGRVWAVGDNGIIVLRTLAPAAARSQSSARLRKSSVRAKASRAALTE